MITAIHLENFKAYGKRTRIPIRPLTFLCGPNNGGKSSITQAIAIAAEILNEGHFDGHRLKLDGGHRDFGGMSMLRHERNPEVNPRIAFAIRFDGEISIESYDVDVNSQEILRGIADRIDVVEVSIDMVSGEIGVELDGVRLASFMQSTERVIGGLQLHLGRWPEALITGESESDRSENAERAVARWFFHHTDDGTRLRERIESEEAWSWNDGASDPEGLLGFIEREVASEKSLLEAASDAWADAPRLLSRAPTPPFLKWIEERSGRLQEMRFEADSIIRKYIGAGTDSEDQIDLAVDPESGEPVPGYADLSTRGQRDFEVDPIVDFDDLLATVQQLFSHRMDDPYEDEWTESWTEIGILDELVQAAGLPPLGRSREPVALRIFGGIRLDRPLGLDRDLLSGFEGSAVEGAGARRLLEAALDLLILAPCRELRAQIGDGIFLGPIRSIAGSRLPRSSDSSWFDGSRGWAELLWGYRAPSETSVTGEAVDDRRDILLRQINEHLGPTFLDMGLVLAHQYRWDRPIDEGVQMGGVELPTSDEWIHDIQHAEEHYESSVHAVVLKPSGDGKVLQTMVSSVGAGFSQVVPCLIALHQGRGRTVSLEQPELHLNPRQMVALGDVLLHAVFATSPENFVGADFEPMLTESTVFVETHSEEVILRVMRRIQERHKAGEKLQENTTADQIIAVYVDQASETFRDRPAIMKIGSDGKWMSPWPDDFFRLSSMERVR
ncbi:AAA family ATPase [bacterium]|nr:AAA family ATPase [bacterium]